MSEPTLLSPWPLEQINDSYNFGRFWHIALKREDLSLARALMEKTGVPQGLNPYTEKPWIESLIDRSFLQVLPSIESQKPDLSAIDKAKEMGLSDMEAIVFSFYKADNLSPDAIFGEKEFFLLEACLHSGWDFMTLDILSHEKSPKPDIWQGWTSNYGSVNNGASGSKMPWLHFLAQTNRHPVLSAMYSMPNVDINQKDRLGRTPIFYANNVQSLKILLSKNPDLDLKGKDGQDLISTWSSLGISPDLVGEMQISLPNNQVVFDMDQAHLNTLAKEILDNMVYRNNWSTPNQSYSIPSLNWKDLNQKSFSRVVGQKDLILDSAEMLSLNLLETKTDEELKALLNVADKNSLKPWEMLIEVYEKILPTQKSSSDQGFLTSLVLSHLLNTGASKVNKGNHYTSGQGPELAGPISDWCQSWELTLGSNNLERLMKTKEQFSIWLPSLNRTGPVTKMISEKEWGKRLSHLTKQDYVQFWNQNTLNERECQNFWSETLRLPVLGPLLLKVLLENFDKLTFENTSEEQQASLYSAATTLWNSYKGKNEWQMNQKAKEDFKKITRWINQWLDAGIPWKALAEDYKWAKGPNNLIKDPMGERLIASVQKGRLTRKITDIEPEAKASSTPRRRL